MRSPPVSGLSMIWRLTLTNQEAKEQSMKQRIPPGGRYRCGNAPSHSQQRLCRADKENGPAAPDVRVSYADVADHFCFDP